MMMTVITSKYIVHNNTLVIMRLKENKNKKHPKSLVSNSLVPVPLLGVTINAGLDFLLLLMDLKCPCFSK